MKDSHASGEKSSVDGKRISDFMGKRRGEFHLTDDLPFREMSHGKRLCRWKRFDRVNQSPPLAHKRSHIRRRRARPTARARDAVLTETLDPLENR